MRCFVIAALLALLSQSAGARPLADEAPSQAGASSGRMRVLVLDLQASGVDAEQAKLVDELLAVELSKEPRFDVISGSDVRRMMELEADKQAAGCEDSSCLAEIAGAMGARYVVYGRVGKLGERFILTLNLFDSEAAGAVGRAQLKPASIDVIPDELPGAVRSLTGGLLGTQGDPASTPVAAEEAPTAAEQPSTLTTTTTQPAGDGPGVMAFVWPIAFVSAGALAVLGGAGFDLLSPTSDDDTLDVVDFIAPAVIITGIGAALVGVLVNPFAEGDDA